MSRSSSIALASTIAAIALGAAAAADFEPPIGHDDAAARAREQRAVDLINRASRQIAHDYPGCREPRRPPAPTFTHDAPSAQLLATFGVLRRAATPEDALGERDLRTLPAQDIYLDDVRVAHSLSGRDFYIVAARKTHVFQPLPVHCARAITRRLQRLARHERPAVRHRALALWRRLAREETAPRPPAEGVFVFEKTTGGVGGGGGGDLAYLRTHGSWGSAGRGANRSVVTGLVPDGVATVTSEFGRVVSRGPYRDPKVYPSRIVRTDRVNENVVSFTVARPAPDALATRMVWRAANGSVVRVVRLP